MPPPTHLVNPTTNWQLTMLDWCVKTALCHLRTSTVFYKSHYQNDTLSYMFPCFMFQNLGWIEKKIQNQQKDSSHNVWEMWQIWPENSSRLTHVSSVSDFTSYRSMQQRVQKKMYCFMVCLLDPTLLLSAKSIPFSDRQLTFPSKSRQEKCPFCQWYIATHHLCPG